MRLKSAGLTLVVAVLTGSLPAQGTAGGTEIVDQPAAKAVHLLTPTTAVVPAGSAAWVALNWTATSRAHKFRVTAAASDGVVVTYPDNTGDHTSAWTDEEWVEAELDYTALHLTVPAGAPAHINLFLTVTYEVDDVPFSQEEQVEVPVTPGGGGGVSALTHELGPIASNASTWVDLWYASDTPVSGFRLVATDPGGLSLLYPDPGLWSSLYNDDVLDAGEKDVARLRLDTFGLTAGTYELTIEVDYALAGSRGHLDHTVQVVVGPVQVSGLSLTPLCWHPSGKFELVVHNPNPFAVSLTWDMVGKNVSGSLTAQPGETSLYVKQKGEVRIFWADAGGVGGTASALVHDAKCEGVAR